MNWFYNHNKRHSNATHAGKDLKPPWNYRGSYENVLSSWKLEKKKKTADALTVHCTQIAHRPRYSSTFRYFVWNKVKAPLECICVSFLCKLGSQKSAEKQTCPEDVWVATTCGEAVKLRRKQHSTTSSVITVSLTSQSLMGTADPGNTHAWQIGHFFQRSTIHDPFF